MSSIRNTSITAFLFLSLGIFGCSGSDGTNGANGTDGTTGADGADGATGASGGDGTSGVACWDLNANGVGDVLTEDTNDDGNVNLHDCRAVGITMDLSDADVVAQMVEEGNRIVAEITNVTLSSHPVVEFSLSDSKGTPLVGCTVSKVRATLAKLLPASSIMPARWQNYINLIAEADGDGDDVLPLALQASRDSSTLGGTLIDYDDGMYAYTFGTDVTIVTDPVVIAWEPTLTHRLGLEVRINSEINPANPTTDFVPNGDAITLTRDVVATATCNDCHQKLALHGGARFETDYCVTCHNPGTRDQEDGALVDLAHMVHAIHSATQRADVGGAPYIVADNDYSEVTYPRSTLYCEKCHTDASETPDGDNWKTVVNSHTCGGCHVDGLVTGTPDVDTGLSTYQFNHVNWGNFLASNNQCTTCHFPGTPIEYDADGAGGEEPISADVELAHLKGEKKEALLGQELFEFQISSITDVDVDDKLEITYAVYNPDAGTFYNINTDANFQAGGLAGLNLRISWNTGDYSNEGSASATGAAAGTPAQPHAINLATLKANSVDNLDGTYTVEATTALPVAATGAVAVAMDGHPLADVDGDGTVENLASEEALPKSIVAYYDAGQPRRTVVEITRCNNCHEWLSLHGGNRNSETQVCVVCHNQDATDVNRRAGAGINWTAPDSTDGKGEESIAMGHMAHGIHASNYVAYGNGNTKHDYYEVTFPGQLNNCTACHAEDTYYQPSGDERPVTVGVGADRRIPSDDEFVTPFAAVCTPCHSTDLAQAHMTLNGAIIQDGDPNTVETIDKGTYLSSPPSVETCPICHGPGKLADIGVVHGVK